MRIFPPFPEDRREDPMRRAEMKIHDLLAASDVPGRTLYEVRPAHWSRELDFLLVFPELKARIAVEVRGGVYRLLDDGWQLRTAGGWQPRPEPFPELTKATDVLRNLLFERLGSSNVILNVLAFPDVESGPEIEAHASASGGHAIRGTERPLELAGSCDIHCPSAPTETDQESAAVAGSWPAPASQRIQAGNVIIQHTNVVNIYMTSGPKGEWTVVDPGHQGRKRRNEREPPRIKVLTEHFHVLVVDSRSNMAASWFARLRPEQHEQACASRQRWHMEN